ncbi:hypothetical protein ACJX0J_028281, partial [Zea mays]
HFGVVCCLEVLIWFGFVSCLRLGYCYAFLGTRFLQSRIIGIVINAIAYNGGLFEGLASGGICIIMFRLTNGTCRVPLSGRASPPKTIFDLQGLFILVRHIQRRYL